ncbi:hypothetical protein EC991_005150 [Linnemannia zychae]|nr:hypothetical protein EC991_005150 [Linnemannia zychae]
MSTVRTSMNQTCQDNSGIGLSQDAIHYGAPNDTTSRVSSPTFDSDMPPSSHAPTDIVQILEKICELSATNTLLIQKLGALVTQQIIPASKFLAISKPGFQLLPSIQRTLDEYKIAVRQSDAEAEVFTRHKLKRDIVDLQRLHGKYESLLKVEGGRAYSFRNDIHDESLELARRLFAQTLDD